MSAKWEHARNSNETLLAKAAFNHCDTILYDEGEGEVSSAQCCWLVLSIFCFLDLCVRLGRLGPIACLGMDKPAQTCGSDFQNGRFWHVSQSTTLARRCRDLFD